MEELLEEKEFAFVKQSLLSKKISTSTSHQRDASVLEVYGALAPKFLKSLSIIHLCVERVFAKMAKQQRDRKDLHKTSFHLQGS
jgi:hypothetical protein